MSPVATLRTAAKKARSVAAEATVGPWDHWQDLEDGRLEVYVPNGTMSTETILEFKDYTDCEECVRPSTCDAEYIAAWHPKVTAHLADAWDALAEQYAPYSSDLASASIAGSGGQRALLAAAVEFLGGDE